MHADAIQRVSGAIAREIKDALDAGGHPNSIVVIGPPEEENTKKAQLVLFPFKIVPTPSLRNSERVLPPDAQGHVSTFENSLPLDVSYLLTIGNPTVADSEVPTAPDSHLWLGLAMRALQSNPDFVGEQVDGDTVRVSLESTSTEEMSRIWALFPKADYLTSVVYVASPVWIDPVSAVIAPRVVDDRRLVGQRVA
jgi:hypothetical protein